MFLVRSLLVTSTRFFYSADPPNGLLVDLHSISWLQPFVTQGRYESYYPCDGIHINTKSPQVSLWYIWFVYCLPLVYMLEQVVNENIGFCLSPQGTATCTIWSSDLYTVSLIEIQGRKNAHRFCQCSLVLYNRNFQLCQGSKSSNYKILKNQDNSIFVYHTVRLL